MAITTSLNVTDGDAVLSGVQVYPGQALTITLTAALNQSDGDSYLTFSSLGSLSFRYIDASNSIVGSRALSASWTLSGDTNSNGRVDPGELFTWTSPLTLPADIATNPGNVNFTAATAYESVRFANSVFTFDNGLDPETGSAATAGKIFVVDEANPSLDLVKTAGQSTYQGGGETILYNFAVANTGNRTLTNLTLSDPKLAGPATLVLVGDTDKDGVQDAGETWGEDYLGDTDGDGAFDAGETWHYWGTYTTTSDDKSAIVNTATASAFYGASEKKDVDSVTVNYDPPFTAAPGIQLFKTVSSVTDKSAPVAPTTLAQVLNPVDEAGDIVNYAITVTNTGNVALTNVVVLDPLLGEDPLTLVSGDTDGDGELDLTETWTYAGSYAVTQADFDDWGGEDGDIDNTASVTAKYSGEDITDDDSQEVALVLKASIDVVKTGYRLTDFNLGFDPTGKTDAQIYAGLLNGANPWTTFSDNDVGQTVVYGIPVKNDGNVALHIDNVIDTLLPGGVVPFALNERILGDIDNDELVDVGETWYLGAQYTITDANKGSRIDNLVTVYASNDAVGEDSFVFDADDHSIAYRALYEGLSQGYWGTHIPGSTKRGEKADLTWEKDWDAATANVQKYMDASFETFFFGSQQASVTWGTKLNGKTIVNISDVKLSEAVNLGAGGQFALARDAAAAVMNAERADILYKYTVSQIRDMVRDAFNINDGGASNWTQASLQAELNANNMLGLQPDAPLPAVGIVGTPDLSSWLMAAMP